MLNRIAPVRRFEALELRHSRKRAAFYSCMKLQALALDLQLTTSGIISAFAVTRTGR
jgi:hypothetical protein